MIVVQQWVRHLAPAPLTEHPVASRLVHATGSATDTVSRLAVDSSITTITLHTADLPISDRDVCSATVLSEGTVADQLWERALDEWRAPMAITYVGLARQAFEIAVEVCRGFAYHPTWLASEGGGNAGRLSLG